MNTNLLRIMGIALATLFLSAQAFACSGVSKGASINKTNQLQYSMYDDNSSSSDRDMSSDQGSSENSEQPGQTETEEPDSD